MASLPADFEEPLQTGGRNIDYIMKGSIMPRMSQEILLQMGETTTPIGVHLDLAKAGSFMTSFDGGKK
ncbi:MAG: hypothetical protein GTO24_10210 [candidate division Zixibacteria bacterium]|nr:hypothetical protein [candidate division Zixibacteria bacterium]